MTTPSKDISKYDLTDEQSAISPAYAGGLFGALIATQSQNGGKLSKIYEYETPGTYSVTVPEGVNAMLVLGACGGGGGAGSNCISYFGGYGGNSGEAIINKIKQVTPGNKLSIIIGCGGQNAGSNGSSTSFAGFTMQGGYCNAYKIPQTTSEYQKGHSSTSGWYTVANTSTYYNSNNIHASKGGGYDANGLIGIGGYGGGMIIEKTNGGDGYLCFMFVNYNFNA